VPQGALPTIGIAIMDTTERFLLGMTVIGFLGLSGMLAWLMYLSG
jgi:hypothetical protein